MLELGHKDNASFHTTTEVVPCILRTGTYLSTVRVSPWRGKREISERSEVTQYVHHLFLGLEG